MAQVIEHLLSKCEMISLNLSTVKKNYIHFSLENLGFKPPILSILCLQHKN
jgi:hypothetical protein